MGPGLDPLPLLDREEWANLGARFPPIQGSIGLEDVLSGFTKGSIDVIVHSRPAVRHFTFDRDRAWRVDPLALGPRDFVDEWLTSGWKEAQFWSEERNSRSLREWRRKLHKDRVRAEILYPATHGSKTPDLWQVGVDFSDPPAVIGAVPKTPVCFLVRWRPPCTFRMVQVGMRPSSACAEQDREADGGGRSLFPVEAGAPRS